MKHTEAERQSDLLAAILASNLAAIPAKREPDQDVAPGLQIYRANARASAARGLASNFPTVAALLGEANFQALAQSYWSQHPQRQGDLAEWGDELAAFIALQPGLQTWPYLADCARLDWAVHRCERAADSMFDAASMGRLAGNESGTDTDTDTDTDLASLRLQFMPGTALITSDWPLQLIHQAHALPEGDARDRRFAEVRDALAAPRASAFLVARFSWRAVVSAVESHEIQWTQQLLSGASLDVALSQADAEFDFAVWLANAVRAGQLKGISTIGD